MKNITRSILVLLLLSLNTEYSFSQLEEYDIIRISHVSYVHKPFGAVKEQLKIDLKHNKVFYRKNLRRKFKEVQTIQNISLFNDSIKMARLKEISKLISKNNDECLYHNEYGYFKIEVIKLNREDEIYGEIFLINQPYNCKDENDQGMVRVYYDLIKALFNRT